MKQRYTAKTVVALTLRAIGLVALALGVAILLRWMLFEVTGGSRSGPFRLFYSVVGLPCTLLMVLCRALAARLLRAA